MPDSKIEDLCEQTDSPCVWQSEEFYDEEGNLDSWDMFCKNCYRWRDWSKSEGPRPDTHVVHR